MFGALFKFFLVWFLVCVIASNLFNDKNPKLSLLWACMGTIGLIVTGLGAFMLLVGGQRVVVISFLGSWPITFFAVLTILSPHLIKFGRKIRK